MSSSPPTRRSATTIDDRDGDGLTNEVEKRLGTNPNNPDTDGDGLLDGWEVYGVNGIDLPGKGASPLHKDIFVEMDYYASAPAPLTVLARTMPSSPP